ncbi:MAG TPA: two-component sensor histidine kinase, partial [Pseudomonas sp.]|nr:two-component sensor histidine kinase [Pseudomonas sp.]
MRVTSTARQLRHFNLIRWFSLTALASIAVVSALAAWVFSGFLTERMIRQEAEITAGFVRSIVATEDAYAYFDGSRNTTAQQLQGFLDHMIRIPGVLRTNVYSADRLMVWSSDHSLIGQRFERNDELEEALRADLVVHSGIIDPAHLPKSEHQHLAASKSRFIESYVPIFDAPGRRVVGVVELYKVPAELFKAIEAGVMLIWLASGIAGLFLYATLFWIVRRAHGIIEAQGDQLVESESLAVVGEMGSAVAHGLRNPLASIRSSAELS